jgi:hypothetical protein
LRVSPRARLSGASICEHIRKYYPNVGGEPPVFWIFDEAILPHGARLVQKRSDTGDDCHFNIATDKSNNFNALNKGSERF